MRHEGAEEGGLYPGKVNCWNRSRIILGRSRLWIKGDLLLFFEGLK
jgi:hypothetical protein